jgi:hypothetical protein
VDADDMETDMDQFDLSKENYEENYKDNEESIQQGETQSKTKIRICLNEDEENVDNFEPSQTQSYQHFLHLHLNKF